MRIRTVGALVVGLLLGLAGCAFHHNDTSSNWREDYVDWESEPERWGDHYYHDGPRYPRWR